MNIKGILAFFGLRQVTKYKTRKPKISNEIAKMQATAPKVPA